MKPTFIALLALCLYVPVVGADKKKPLTKEESAKVIEVVIRKQIRKTTGALTKADLEKVTRLDLEGTYITDLTPLSKLTELKHLWLENTPISDLMPLVGLTKLEGIGLQNNLKLTRAELGRFKDALLKGNAQSTLAKETKIDPATGIPAFPRPQGKKQQWTTFGTGQNNLAMWKGHSGRTVMKFFGVPDLSKPYGAYGGGVWTYMGMKITTANRLKAERVYFVVGRGVVHSVHLFEPKALAAPMAAQKKKWFAGGNLHNATMRQWAMSSYNNQLATAADWLTGSKRRVVRHLIAIRRGQLCYGAASVRTDETVHCH
jgi:hypothetical protein